MPKKLKLRVTAYLKAGEVVATSGLKEYCCNCIDRAVRHDDPLTSSAETDFFRDLFQIEGPSHTFGYKLRHELGVDADESYRPQTELRLMALALCHTLAVEHNRGRKIL